MKFLKNKKVLLSIIVVVILLLVGLLVFLNTKKNPSSDNIKDDEIRTTTKKVNIVNEDSKSRPYAVMVNNVDGARKLQSGLQDAYMVYEMMVEGGITRYLALFLDQSSLACGLYP